jgi:hypothetical protein
MGNFIGQLRLVTQSGIKGKDDCVDTISMLGYLKPWKPSFSGAATPDEVDLWEEQQELAGPSSLSSYIV